MNFKILIRAAIAFIIPLLMFCCSSSSYSRSAPRYVILADQVSADVGEKLSNKYNMAVFGTSGSLMKQVNHLGLSFQIRGPLSKETLREILVDSVNEFLQSINENEELKPFLKLYPFTPNEVSIELFVIDKSRRSPFYPDIAVAAASENQIEFLTNDPLNSYAYKTIEKEPFSEALKIVNEAAK